MGQKIHRWEHQETRGRDEQARRRWHTGGGLTTTPRYEAYSAALAARKQATVATHECEVEFLSYLWQHPIFRAALERAWEGFGVGVLGERPARAAGHVAVRVGPRVRTEGV